MTRPVTSTERAKIDAVRRKYEKARETADALERERDLAILDAYERRANVGDLAAAAGVSRQTVHKIVKRLEQG